MTEEEINLKEKWQTLQNFLKNTLGKSQLTLMVFYSLLVSKS